MLKLNVGASRKVSDNHYGSRGASINLELELDSGLVGEADRLRDKMRQLFGLARAALAEELSAGNAQPGATGHVAEDVHAQPVADPAAAPPVPSPSPKPTKLATQSQIKALYAIARSQKVDLLAFMRQRMAIARPEDLSLQQASRLIDELKGSTSGQGRAS
jgi:hypothetical protein